MNFWKQFLDSLDTPGGHIVILGLLLGAGLVASYLKVAKSDEITVGAFSALLLALKGVARNNGS